MDTSQPDGQRGFRDLPRVSFAVISDEQRASGEWLNEQQALSLSGLQLETLRKHRQNGRIQSLPALRGGNGAGRDFWYLRSDVERRALGRRGSTNVVRTSDDTQLLRELELAMAKAEAKEQELGRVRAELRGEIVVLEQQLVAARQTITRLEGDVRRLARQVQISVENFIVD